MRKMEKSQKFQFTVLAFFLLIGSESVSALFGFDFADIKEMVGWSYDVYSKLNEAYDTYGTFTADVSLGSIISQVQAVAGKIDELGVKIEQKIDNVMDTILRLLPLIQQQNDAMRQLAETVNAIDRLYNSFENYLNHSSRINNVTMVEFVNAVTSPDVGKLPDVLYKMWRLIVPGYDEFGDGLFIIIGKWTQESSRDLCNTAVSAQQRIQQLYERIVTSEMKAYVMTLFAYSMKEIFSEGKFAVERMTAENEFARKSTVYLKVARQALEAAPREIRRCDPELYTRNETFLEFERYVQAFIVNEADINADRSCGATCSTVVKSSSIVYGCSDQKYCPRRTCRGEVVDCSYIGGPVSICEKGGNALKRYDWFRSADSLYGADTQCSKPQYINSLVRVMYMCDYCLCTCIQDDHSAPNTIHTLSFRDKLSLVDKNLIVSSVKFVALYGMIHLQIMQGPLLPFGKSNKKRQRWMPVETMEYNKEASEKKGWGVFNVFVPTDDGLQPQEMNLNVDYGLLNRRQRQIQLDDVILPHDYVVTGVRFNNAGKPKNQEDLQPFRLEVHGTPFDYKTGKLMPTADKPSMWFNSDNMPNRPPQYYGRSRKQLTLNKPGNPILYFGNYPDSEPNMYVDVRASDLSSDAGQSTIPFLDAQQVGGKVSFPLSGVGLFHKGVQGSGGFLALRVFSLDLTKYIQLPEEEEEEEEQVVDDVTTPAPGANEGDLDTGTDYV